MLCKPRWSLHKICQYSSCSPFQTKLLSGGFWQTSVSKLLKLCCSSAFKLCFRNFCQSRNRTKARSLKAKRFLILFCWLLMMISLSDLTIGKGQGRRLWTMKKSWVTNMNEDMNKFTPLYFENLLISKLMKSSHLSQSSFIHRLIVKLSCWLKSESLVTKLSCWQNLCWKQQSWIFPSADGQSIVIGFDGNWWRA